LVKQFFKDTAFDSVRLAVAIWGYLFLSPHFEKLVSPAPAFWGDAIAGIIAAVATVLFFWVIFPWSTIEIIFGRVDTGAAIPNPIIELACAANTSLVAHYDVTVRHKHRGAIGWAIARWAASKDPIVEVVILNSKLSFTGEQPECRGTDRGFEIELGEMPRSGDWADPSVTIDSGAIDNKADLGVSSALRVTSRAAWFFQFFVLTSTNIKTIQIRKTT
jgi:hypothetical protein